MNRRVFLVVSSVGAAAALAALLTYRGRAKKRPFNLRLGQDKCRRCGMIIGRLEFAAGLILSEEDDWHYYDDVGCFFRDYADYIGRGESVHDARVIDFKARQLVDADKALYVAAEPKSLWTPMGYGVVALEKAEDAREVAERYNGVLKTFNELLDWARGSAKQ